MKSVMTWVLILIAGIAIIVASTTLQPTQAEAWTKPFLPPPKNPELFTFGYKENFADLYWIRVIQDMDNCKQSKAELVINCSKGWVYKMINAITELAPDWVLAYRIGATVLSVVVDDIPGATAIFDKGTKRFPAHYNLNYAAAYHAIYEEKNPKKAAELILHSARSGGPAWFYSLAAKLYTEGGQRQLGIDVLENALKEPHSDEAKERILWRLKQLKGEAVPEQGPGQAGS